MPAAQLLSRRGKMPEKKLASSVRGSLYIAIPSKTCAAQVAQWLSAPAVLDIHRAPLSSNLATTVIFPSAVPLSLPVHRLNE